MVINICCYDKYAHLWPPSSKSPGQWCELGHYLSDPPVSGCHHRPLPLEDLYKLAQGLHDELGLHHGPVVCVDQTLVEEDQDQFLGPGCMDLG